MWLLKLKQKPPQTGQNLTLDKTTRGIHDMEKC